MAVFDSSTVNQSGIVAEKVVGRDDNSINLSLNLNGPTIYKEDKVLKNLLEEHEAEKRNDPAYREFSDDLNKFFSKSLKVKIRNLEEKLIAGDRDYLVEVAMECEQ